MHVVPAHFPLYIYISFALMRAWTVWRAWSAWRATPATFCHSIKNLQKWKTCSLQHTTTKLPSSCRQAERRFILVTTSTIKSSVTTPGSPLTHQFYKCEEGCSAYAGISVRRAEVATRLPITPSKFHY